MRFEVRTMIVSFNIKGCNKMNRKEQVIDSTVTIDRLRMLEKRIEELEAKLTRERELFLDEDLKVRGLK